MTHRSPGGSVPLRGLAVATLVLAAGLVSTEARESALTPERRDDVVQARQLLMDAIEEAVPPLDAAAAGQPGDVKAAADLAYRINTLLAAFPHLFPDGTKPEQIGPDGVATNALPALWERFDDFYALSHDAAAAALEASQAKDGAALGRAAKSLRQACDGCHAAYMRSADAPAPPAR